MAYCSHCGKPLAEGDVFCSGCGRPVTGGGAGPSLGREAAWDGRVRRCPNCGETLESLIAYCPSCGCEIRDREASESLSELADRIARVDEKKNDLPKKKGLFASADWLTQIAELNQQKASIIRSFPIPSDVEEIKEFVILAASSVDAESYSSFQTRHNSSSSREVSDAWLAKCEQAMRKARLASMRQCDVSALQDSVDAAKDRIRRAKRKGILQWVGLFSWLPISLVIIVAVSVTLPGRIRDENARLEGVVEEIEHDLDDGEYLHALLLADSLELQVGGDANLETTWEINREYWMNRVVDEAGENGVDLSERAEQMNEERNIENESSSERIQRNIDEFNEEMSKAQEAFENAMNSFTTGGE